MNKHGYLLVGQQAYGSTTVGSSSMPMLSLRRATAAQQQQPQPEQQHSAALPSSNSPALQFQVGVQPTWLAHRARHGSLLYTGAGMQVAAVRQQCTAACNAPLSLRPANGYRRIHQTLE